MAQAQERTQAAGPGSSATGLLFPRIFLLPTHLDAEALRQLETQIPTRTQDPNAAEIFLGRVTKRERALFELRRLGLDTVEVRTPATRALAQAQAEARAEARDRARRATKRKKVSEQPASAPASTSASTLPIIVLSSSSEDEEEEVQKTQPPSGSSPGAPPPGATTIKVVQLAWFTDSLSQNKVLPLTDYLVYEGRKRPQAPQQALSPAPAPAPATADNDVSRVEGILKRARADTEARPRPSWSGPHGWSSHKKTFATPVHEPTHARMTTPEHDADSDEKERAEAQALPPIPAYLHTVYSCQRPTPVHPPNERFVEVLKRIRVARVLTGDRIGVRAYSTAIASVAAYPHVLSTAAEVARLPGCGAKIAELYREFAETDGHVREADDDDADARLAVLRTFYNIWGVAETTARAFYNRGWRDLDDVVEYGWSSLTRVQQIGVKYYDEFQQLLTRQEVETIAARVLEHARALDAGFEMVIAGGYRRGKALSGDVDVILSHRDEAVTAFAVARLVLSLEQAGLITHTLSLSTANSERGQEAVRLRGGAGAGTEATAATGGRGGSGFDTLDKALVVWQEPAAEDDDGDATDAAGTERKRENRTPHRRVDIIVSPWKTVGCAVLGWSSGTTFQRDLRRYCKYERGLRFDSSGARRRLDGAYVDLEDYARDPAPDMLTAERRVFAALALEWRPPEERCTG